MVVPIVFTDYAQVVCRLFKGANRPQLWAHHLRDLSLLAWVLAASVLAAPVFAAGPSGGVVTTGSAVITQSAIQTTIKQSSDKAVINWGNFSIGSGSTVRFVQPSGSSIALNRVTGTQASVIQGALQGNGQVWVLNPNGVLIAPGGQVAASSFLVTTRSLTDQQFMAGNYAFTHGGVSGASVVNQGSITVGKGGYAVLAGEAVRNEGYIEANLGQVVLGGAKAFTLDLSGDNTLAFVVTAPVDVTPTDGKAIVDNTGSIQAAGGRVLMTARAASQLVGQVINTDGVVAATSAQLVNGKIVLDGGTGSVSVGGNLNASGKGAGQTGGVLDVSAKKIQVKANATIDVSGDAGGGKIAIGGGGPSTRTHSFTPAVSTTIASGARLDASALTLGDGGEILVFTELKNPSAFTQVAGSLIARGGAQSGNGGFVETSGYRLDVGGIVVNTLAPKGRRGLWLLDPEHIVISSDATSTEDTGCLKTVGGLTNCSTVNATDLNLLLESTGVTLTADKSITISAALSWSNASKLTFDAGTTILVSASITGVAVAPGGGELSLIARTGITVNSQISMDFRSYGTGEVTMDSGAGITINAPVLAGTKITINANKTAGSNALVSVGAVLHSNEIAVNASTGSLIVTGAGQINSGLSIDLTAKDVTLNGTFQDVNRFTITGSNSVNINSALSATTITVAVPGGALDVAAGFTSANTVTLSADSVTFSAAYTNYGALNVTATSAIFLNAAYASAGETVLAAPVVNWNAGWFGSPLELQTNRVNWGAAGAYSVGGGTVLTVGAPTVAGTTTFNLGRDLTLQATRININNPLTWSTYQLSLNADQTTSPTVPDNGVALSASLTGTNGAKLVVSRQFGGSGIPQFISLTGTPATQSTFALIGYSESQTQTEGTKTYAAGAYVNTVVIDNSGAVGGGGSGGGSSETTVSTPVVAVVAVSASATAAAEAAAKAAADAAAAKAATDVATAKAAALDTATKAVVEQAITQAVATVVASTSAAVFVAP